MRQSWALDANDNLKVFGFHVFLVIEVHTRAHLECVVVTSLRGINCSNVVMSVIRQRMLISLCMTMDGAPAFNGIAFLYHSIHGDKPPERVPMNGDFPDVHVPTIARVASVRNITAENQFRFYNQVTEKFKDFFKAMEIEGILSVDSNFDKFCLSACGFFERLQEDISMHARRANFATRMRRPKNPDAPLPGESPARHHHECHFGPGSCRPIEGSP